MACEEDDFFTLACLKQLHASGIDPGDGGGGGGGGLLSASYESTGSFFGLPLEPLADFTYDGAGLDDDFLEDLMDQLEDESTADKFLADSIFGDDFDLMTEEALADVDDFESCVLSDTGSNGFSSSSDGGINCLMELDDEVENSKVGTNSHSSSGLRSAPNSSPSKKNSKKGLMKSSNSLLSRATLNESNGVPRGVMSSNKSSNKSSNSSSCIKKVSKVKRKKAGVSLLAKPSKQVKSLLDTSRSSNNSCRTVPASVVVPNSSSNSSNSPIFLKTSKGDFRISKVVVDTSNSYGKNGSSGSSNCKVMNGMIVKRIQVPSGMNMNSKNSQNCVSMKAQFVTTKSNNQSIQLMQTGNKCTSSSSSMPSTIVLSSNSSSGSNTSSIKSITLFQDHDYCPSNPSLPRIIFDN